MNEKKYNQKRRSFEQCKLKGAKFGDVIVNYWASWDNPHRQGIFIKYGKNSAHLTDMSGSFWELCNDRKSKSEIVGNVYNQLTPAFQCAKALNRTTTEE